VEKRASVFGEFGGKGAGMRALLTGITGQDGSYMAELLLGKGYKVFGNVRRSSVKKFDRIQSIIDDVELVEGDVTDQSSLDSTFHSVQPDEVYDLAAQSFVPVSWNQPVLTGDVTGLGVIRMLEAMRKHFAQAKFLSSPKSVRGSQGIWTQHDRELSRELRAVC
jgi:GDPmannose 4,6-dehydratase